MADQQEPSQSQQQQQAPPQLTSRRGSLLNDTPFPETTTARVVTSAPVHTHTRKRSLSQLALRLLQPLTQDGSSSSTMTATPTSSAASSPFPSAAHTPPRSGSATPTSGSAAPQTTDPALMEATHQWSLSATDYAVGAAIGFGSSAIVYEALYLPLQKRVAIKMLDLDMFERNQIDELRKELQVMTLSRHPNLLPVLVSFVEESKLWIVTPYLGGGSCLDLLRNRFADGIADEAAVATVLRECLLGLEYLHRNHLLHRDVKAGNCLLAEDGGVMLADFGVSASLSEGGERGKHRKTFVGTPCWMVCCVDGGVLMLLNEVDRWASIVTASL